MTTRTPNAWIRTRLAALALIGCSASEAVDPGADDAASRDSSPVQTDSVLYHLVRYPGEYRAYVSATYTNRTNAPVYFARCSGSSTTPMFGVSRTGPDSAAKLFSDFAWACVGGVPTGVINAGASVTVQASLGSFDQPRMTPPLLPEQLIGQMRVHLSLCSAYVPDSDRCVALPRSESQSNAFRVTY